MSDYHILALHHDVLREPGMSDDDFVLKRLVYIMRCIGTLMNREKFTGEPGVIEYDIPDRHFKGQLHLTRDKGEAVTDPGRFLPPHLQITVDSERLFELDEQMKNNQQRNVIFAEREFRGSQALLDRVLQGMKSGKCVRTRL